MILKILRVTRILPLFIVPLLLCCASLASFAAEKPLPVLKGKLIFTYPVKGEISFTYALLSIDGAGVGLSNNLPLRFDLDTSAFADGHHTLSIDMFDDAGLLEKFPPSEVIFRNNLIPERIITEPVAQLANINKDAAAAASNVKLITGMPMIYFDGHLAAEEMRPFFSNNRIMVLLRPLTDLAGCQLKWKGNSGSINFAAQQYPLALGSNINWLDNSSVTLLQPFIMRNNRVFAPVSMWQQLFNAPLRYDASTKSVYLTSFTQHPVTTPVNCVPDTKPLDIAMASKELPTVAIVVDSTEEIE